MGTVRISDWRCHHPAASAQEDADLFPPCVAGVVSLVAVHPSTVSTLGKQLLPKTFGQSNVNIAQHVVRAPGWRLAGYAAGLGSLSSAHSTGMAARLTLWECVPVGYVLPWLGPTRAPELGGCIAPSWKVRVVSLWNSGLWAVRRQGRCVPALGTMLGAPHGLGTCGTQRALADGALGRPKQPLPWAGAASRAECSLPT